MLGKQEVGPVSKPFVANSTVINSLTKVETEKTTNDNKMTIQDIDTVLAELGLD